MRRKFHSTRLVVITLGITCLLHSVSLSGVGGNSEGRVVDATAIDNKIDPALRYLANVYATAANSPREGGAPGSSIERLVDGRLYFRLHERALPTAAERGNTRPATQVFIRVRDKSNLAELQRAEVECSAIIGDIIVADLPITNLCQIAASDNIVSVQASGSSRPTLNVSRAETRVQEVHSGAGGLPQSYKGRGVVVGIVDSGIDWTHPDFSVAPGNTRILSILDYASGPQTGREWTKAQIDASPSPVTEIDGQGAGGHGTHVAGIATGGGKLRGDYVGMAPECDIIAVKGIRDQDSDGGFSDADVVNGVSYIITKAKSLGKPAVVNLSLGGHFGPHDGTSLYEQALSNLVSPGYVIIAAGGNEGAEPVHLSYSAAGTDLATARQTLWVINQGEASSVVDLWYQTGNISVGIAAYSVQGTQLISLGNTKPVGPGQSLDNQPFVVNGITAAKVTIDARTTSDPNNGAKRALFKIDSEGGFDLSQIVWSLYTFGSGTFDAWVVTGGYFTTDAVPSSGIMPGDNAKTVGTPATAKRVVCVGSYVTKTSWVDIDGNTQQQQGATLGSVSSFSSRGPSRDGRTKPDIVAPGEVIVSALSSNASPQRGIILQGGGLLIKEGTSMASPHVTGIAALMLEKNRYLTYESVLSLLASTATPMGQANAAGAGKVNALHALLATPAGVDCASLSKITGYDCEGNRVMAYELMEAYPNPFNPSTTILYRLSTSEKVELRVYDVLGRLVRTLEDEVVTEGVHRVLWDGRDDRGAIVSGGVYFYRLATARYAASKKAVLIK